MTIAAHTHVHPRTLADTQAQVGNENVHYGGLRTWLRDEEAAGSSGHPNQKFQVDGLIAHVAAGPLTLYGFDRGIRRQIPSDFALHSHRAALARDVRGVRPPPEWGQARFALQAGAARLPGLADSAWGGWIAGFWPQDAKVKRPKRNCTPTGRSGQADQAADCEVGAQD